MGIANANQFVDKIDIPLTKFYKKRIAIDFLNYIFTFLSICAKSIVDKMSNPLDGISQDELFKVMMTEFFRFNNRLMNYKITPVWIWDGKSEDNKLATKQERKSLKKPKIEERDNLRKQLLEMDILERPTELLERYKKLLISTVYINVKKIEEFSFKCGVPVFRARDEAENLGASLCVERKTAAIWTSDTDTYPLGAPIVVKKINNINGIHHFKSVYTPRMLYKLDMNHAEYRDFCILLGTDFNDRLPGVGPKGAMTLIKRYGSLEKIEENTKHNLYGMHYQQVREQLTPYETDYTDKDFQVDKTVNLDIFKDFVPESELLNFANNLRDLPESEPVPKIINPEN